MSSRLIFSFLVAGLVVLLLSSSFFLFRPDDNDRSDDIESHPELEQIPDLEEPDPIVEPRPEIPEISDRVEQEILSAPRPVPPIIDPDVVFQMNEIMQLSESEYPHNPDIAVSNNDVYVVWWEEDNREVFLRRSQDGGQVFGPSQNISMDEGSSKYPDVAVRDGIVIIDWQYSDLSVGRLTYSRESRDGGASFGATSQPPLQDGQSRLDRILMPFEDKIIEVYEASGGLSVRMSTDGGESFGPGTRLSSGLFGRSARPMALTTPGAIHVIWENEIETRVNGIEIHTENLYISTSEDGITFQDPIRVTHYERGVESRIMTTRFASSESNLYVTWRDFPGDIVYFTSSSDNGLSFSDIVMLSDPDTKSLSPQIMVSESSLFVLWSERIPHRNDGAFQFAGPSDILLRASFDGGITFSDTINLSSSKDRVSGAWQVQLLDDALFVVWWERTPGNAKDQVHSEIMFRRVDSNIMLPAQAPSQENNEEIPPSA